MHAQSAPTVCCLLQQSSCHILPRVKSKVKRLCPRGPFNQFRRNQQYAFAQSTVLWGGSESTRNISQRTGRFLCKSEAETEAETDALQELLSWLIANGVKGIGQADSKLGVYEGVDGQRGLLFTEDVDEHVVLLSIPMRLALTDRSLKNPALADPNSPPDVRLAANLLAEMELGLASPWHPFVQALPGEVGSLYGSWNEAATAELQLASLPRDMAHAQNAGQGLKASKKDCKWALSVVNSRSFALPGGNAGELATTFLLPLADFFNHGGETADLLLSGRSSRTANVGWEVAHSEDGLGLTFRCSTIARVEEGEEALISYGQLSSWDCLLFYGFVPPRNATDKVVLFDDLGQAIDWFLDRFPLEADNMGARMAAMDIGEKASPPIANELKTNTVAVVHHEAIVATARLEGDARLWDAFNYLTSLESVKPTRAGSGSRVDGIVAFRVAERLFSPQVTSLLTDLKLLASSSAEDEEERAYFATLLNYYTRVISEFDEEFSGFKLLAKTLQPRSNGKEVIESNSSHFDSSCQVALKFRTSQKQIMWDLMLSLLR